MTPKPPKIPSVQQPDDSGQESAKKRAPKFKELVVQEQHAHKKHAHTHEQILRLRKGVTAEQCQDYLARPENVVLARDFRMDYKNEGSHTLDSLERVRELLIIAKLWLIQDAEMNFIRVDETVADMQLNLDHGLLNKSGEFREGVLPLFDRFNLAASADFRSVNNSAESTSLNDSQLIDVSKIKSLILDFSFSPAYTFEFNDGSGAVAKRKYLRVKSLFDSNGNQMETHIENIYVNVDALMFRHKIERYQFLSDLSPKRVSEQVEWFMRDNYNEYEFLCGSLNVIKSRLGLKKAREIVEGAITDKEYFYLLSNLLSIKKVLANNGVATCKKIVEGAIIDKQYRALLSNLSAIKEVYNAGPQPLCACIYFNKGIAQCKKIVEGAITHKQYSGLLSNLSAIKTVYGKNGIAECKKIIEGAIIDKQYRDLLSNLSAIKEVLGKKSKIKILDSLIADKRYSRILVDDLERYVSTFNVLHDQSNSVRFESLNYKPAEDMYLMMTLAQSEAYTSTFNGIFNKFIGELKKDNVNSYQFLEELDFLQMRNFIKGCVSYNRLSDFMSLMTKENKRKLLTRVFDKLDKEDNYLNEFVAAAEILSKNAKKYPNLYSELLLTNYKRVLKDNNEDCIKLYGLLINTFVTNANIKEGELHEISKDYHIPSVETVDTSLMFSTDPENKDRMLNVQVHLFYDDKDARSSFKSFMAKLGPATKQTNNYVIIDKKKGNKTVRIFATKPAKNGYGVDSNLSALNTALGELPVHLMVHRGHSYHVNKTIPHIAPRTKLIFLGSCGGYTRIEEVLDKSKNAQVISTQGTGRMGINNPLLFAIRNDLLNKDKIEWSKFWSKLGTKFSGKIKKDWEDYVSPANNYALKFLRTYRGLESKD